MTTLFLLFAAGVSMLVYGGTLALLRRRKPTPQQYRRMMVGAFLVQSAICVWLGYELRGVIDR